MISGGVLEGRVLDVHLVYPAPVAQHHALLVAAERGHHLVPPLEGALLGDAACLGREVELGVVAHEPDELCPGGKVLLGPLEERAGKHRIGPAAYTQRLLPRGADESWQLCSWWHQGHLKAGLWASAASSNVPIPTSSRHLLAMTVEASSAS